VPKGTPVYVYGCKDEEVKAAASADGRAIAAQN
jgi:hypothetical protein